MLKSNLCDYSDAYILAKGAITVARVPAPPAADNVGKEVVFKNCAPFTGCISEINNTQIDNSKDNNIVVPMYNSIAYGDNYSKTSGSLWRYYRDERALNNGAIVNFYAANNSASFKFKQKMTRVTATGGTKDVEITIPLKNLGNFWRTPEMSLIN